MKRNIPQQGQHFLRGRALIGELVGHSNIRRRDTVIDIGAGSGAITSVLASRAAHVIAYEPEPQAATLLLKNMARYSNVTVKQQNFLQASLPAEPYKVFANIPFHLSSQIVRVLTSAPTPPRAVYLIVQKQFAQKLIVSGNHFHGALGMSIAPWWVAKIRRPLRRTDFTPPPAVDTVLLELKPRDETLLPHETQATYSEFVAECYASPTYYHKAGGRKDTRPSELSLEEWCNLFTHQHA